MNIRHRHSLGLDEAKSRIDLVAAELAPRFDLRTAWDGNNLKVSGPGVNGKIFVSHHDVEARITLGLSLRLFEGTIRAAVEEAIDEYFG
jgi:putative polyhydroxyalkanoate system protein